MATKIFLTGVTGYIGGEVFADLYDAHPEYAYSLLVRNEERGKPVLAKYPKVRLVYGSLNDSDVIEKEAAAADVVVHTADSADNLPAATAIAKGLAAGHTSEKPGYWIHLSGTGILMWYDMDNQRFGQPPLPEQAYHDIKDIDRLVNLPDSAIHRDVDKIVLGANSPAVRTALLAPPTIYGVGRGPVNTRSIQVPDLAGYTLEAGFAPVILTGLTEWDNVHIRDLGPLFVKLVEGTRDPATSSNPEMYGPRAYYFARGGVHVWGEVARWIAEAACEQGYLPAPLTKEVTMQEAMNQGGATNGSWGLNSKGVSERALKYFGWMPKEEPLKDTIPNMVEFEAKRMGLVPHEKKN